MNKAFFALLLICTIAVSCKAKSSSQQSQATNSEQTEQDLAHRIAKAYGIENFDNVNSLAFTFNLERDTLKVARNWVWNVKENTVTLNSPAQNITYRRDTIQSEAMKAIDRKFINDQYWLLFPYHLVWDSSAIITEKENATMPLAKTPAKMLTIQYQGTAGYSPGDAYDLYVDNNNMIKEWTYRKGGVAETSLATTWEENIEISGLTLAMNHKNPESKFRIYFTGVKVE